MHAAQYVVEYDIYHIYEVLDEAQEPSEMQYRRQYDKRNRGSKESCRRSYCRG
jgi:hypothetical protein